MSLETVKNVFNKYYQEYVNKGASNQDIVFNFLPDFVEEIAEDWRIDICCASADFSLNEQNPLLRIDHKKSIIITESGDIHYVKIKSEKIGGTIWNGDDEYFEEFLLVANLGDKIGKSENIPELLTTGLITSDKLENTACEILDLILITK